MDAQRLKQYRALQREIRQLERLLGKLQTARARPGAMVADSVQASSSRHPYQQYRAMLIGWAEGDDPAERDRAIKQVEDMLKVSKRRCQVESWRIKRHIESRPDSEERQLLRMRYIEGLSLKEIGEEMHVDLSVVGKKLKKIMH